MCAIAVLDRDCAVESNFLVDGRKHICNVSVVVTRYECKVSDIVFILHLFSHGIESFADRLNSSLDAQPHSDRIGLNPASLLNDGASDDTSCGGAVARLLVRSL